MMGIRITVAVFIVFLSLHWQAKAMICKCNHWYQESRMELRELAEQTADYDEEIDGLAMAMSDCDSNNECEVSLEICAENFKCRNTVAQMSEIMIPACVNSAMKNGTIGFQGCVTHRLSNVVPMENRDRDCLQPEWPLMHKVEICWNANHCNDYPVDRSACLSSN